MAWITEVFLVMLMLCLTVVNTEDSPSQKMAKCIMKDLGSECPSQKTHILNCASTNGGRSLGHDGIRAALALTQQAGYHICPKLTPHVFLDILNNAESNKTKSLIILIFFIAGIIFQKSLIL